MTATLETPTLPREGSSYAEKSSVVRRPVTFDSAHESLFAWLHHVEEQPRFHHGVVICPPIGYEHLHTHRTLRHLADELARLGIPTLRFDWSGHGDSAGTDHDPNRVSTWQQNVKDAIDWMRHSLNGAPISVIGLRIGALLAATSLSDLEIENLVLWAPVYHGREFVREMKAIDYAGDAPRNPDGGPSDSIEAAGFLLTSETATVLSSLQLTSSEPHAQRVLLAQRDDVPIDARFQKWTETLAGSTEVLTVNGYQDMLREPHRSIVPSEAIHVISAWLVQQLRAVPNQHLLDNSINNLDIQFDPNGSTPATITSPTSDFSEEACWVHRSPDMFGILTEPHTPVKNRPTMILLNAGSSYRVGPGRLNVTLAREFAAAGFRSLRIDIQGLGDSPACDFVAENDPYPSTAVSNVNDAIQYLQDRYGEHPCIVMGLCSGAYTAFQAAAQIPAPAFVEAILINPLTYFWREGMTIDDDTTARDLYQQQHYLESAWQPKKWWKLLTGRSQIGVAGAVHLALRKLRQTRQLHIENAETVPLVDDGLLGHPRERNLPGDLHRIANRGRHLRLYFAANDPGHAILQTEARATALKYQASGQMDVHIINHADHTFSREFARQALVSAVIKKFTSLH